MANLKHQRPWRPGSKGCHNLTYEVKSKWPQSASTALLGIWIKRVTQHNVFEVILILKFFKLSLEDRFFIGVGSVIFEVNLFGGADKDNGGDTERHE